MISKDIEFFEEHRTGDLVSRLNSDVDVVENSLSSNVSMFVRCMVSIIATMVIIFILSPILAATFLVGLVPIVFFMLKYANVMIDIAKGISKEKGVMTTIADESLGNIRTVKAFANEEEEVQKFDVLSDNVFKLGKNKAFWTAFFGMFTQLSLYGAMVLIIYVASELYKRDQITIGVITSFLFYLMMLLMNFYILNYSLSSAL